MTTRTLYWGKTLIVTVSVQDGNGDPIVMDENWSAVCGITRSKVGGDVIDNVDMTIADGVATCAIDTGGEAWSPDVYYYDVRVTTAEGVDEWTEAVKLCLENRNAPASL